jgi:hypothetical protein
MIFFPLCMYIFFPLNHAIIALPLRTVWGMGVVGEYNKRGNKIMFPPGLNLLFLVRVFNG